MIEGVRQINKALVSAPLSECREGEQFPVFVDTVRCIQEHQDYFRLLLGIHGNQDSFCQGEM